LRSLCAILAFSLLIPVGAVAAPGEQAAREAAALFAAAMQSGDASKLRPILPSRGKVQLRLERLGPEQGYFSARQVEALLAEFLAEGKVLSLDVLRVEQDREGFALVHARAGLTDRAGRPCRVELHLGLQPEGESWVLREIRETQR
jgi:hypothetical protein